MFEIFRLHRLRRGVSVVQVAILGIALIGAFLSFPSSGNAATAVTVRLFDQDNIEHTLGQICVIGVVGCTTSGGTLMLTVGNTYTFTLKPSVANVRAGEAAVHATLLQRTEVRTVTSANENFNWDRAVWNPLRVTDQGGIDHTQSRFSLAASFNNYLNGDSVRMPVTDAPNAFGTAVTGYPFVVSPSAANSLAPEALIHQTLLTRTYPRTVSVSDNGIFVWDRAVWNPFRVTDQDGVDHTAARISLAASFNNWQAGSVARIPVTDGPNTVGTAASAGYPFVLTPSIANSRAGEAGTNSGALSHTENRTISVADAGVFTWNRAVWNPLLLIDQELVNHASGQFFLGGWFNSYHSGDVVRIPVTDTANDAGTYADGYTFSIIPSVLDSRLGEFRLTPLGRTESRAVSLGTSGTFTWNRAIGRLGVIKNDLTAVPGTTINLSTSLVDALPGDDVRFPETVGANQGAFVTGYDFHGVTGDTLTPYTVNDIRVASSGFLDSAIFFVGADQYEITLSSPSLIDQIQEIIDDVNGLVANGTLNQNDGRKLVNALEKAQDALAVGNLFLAESFLNKFIDEVQKLVSKGDLTASQGQALINAAQLIIDQL